MYAFAFVLQVQAKGQRMPDSDSVQGPCSAPKSAKFTVKQISAAEGLPVDLVDGCEVECHQPCDLHPLQISMAKHGIRVEAQHPSSGEIDQMVPVITLPLDLYQMRVFSTNSVNQIQNSFPAGSGLNVRIVREALVLADEINLSDNWESRMDSIEVYLEKGICNWPRRDFMWIDLIWN